MSEERVWIVGYWGEPKDDTPDEWEIGAIFEDEITARVTAEGLVLLDHKTVTSLFSLPFNMVLPIETMDKGDLQYCRKDGDGWCVWTDE